PLIHCELKRSGVDVSQAYNQIEKYAREGVFSGLFALVQIFVAIQPEEAVYFANPGPDGKFNKAFYFHWADVNSEPVNNWKAFAQNLLSIPMAHQLIGFYTVADDTDGVLKVMRSYQYYAASCITSRVAKRRWSEKDQLGGYIWHTTGSGKTLTSFKSAQLIANSNDADKVVFLMDRVELGTQSLLDYRGFADDADTVQATESTDSLVAKLRSDSPSDTLIVTSIQKMSRVEEANGFKAHDIGKIQKKRIVFIIDEAHRDVFGEMLRTIKTTFPNAIFFGFTGTPIHDENQKKMSTTSDVFGNELHRYSIADGIRDKNVLGFDPYRVQTYRDRDLRQAVALERAKAATEAEAQADPKKQEIYQRYMDHTQVPMAGVFQEDGNYLKGIEDYLPASQYERKAHQCAVVDDILENWPTLSHGGKFHAIFATSSIPEAIQYYQLFKAKGCLKVTALFDPNIDNNGTGISKEEGIVEIIEDYNSRYDMKFQMATYATFKKDISYRLAHKEQYRGIAHTPDQQIDLLIVVDQMLTGFDSKWINTLYLDKILVYEKLIQAFSRTNRLYGPEKPFGTIRYYRKPYTMQRNIEEAFKLYSGDKPLGLFADKLEHNLQKLNALYGDIEGIFRSARIGNFEKLPDDHAERGQFAKLFRQLNNYLEAAQIQGFIWDKSVYEFKNPDGKATVELRLNQTAYLVLALRYKELFSGGSEGGGVDDVPYEIDPHLTEINTGVIDAEYMNSRFQRFYKAVSEGEETTALLDELHKSFATLTQEEQKYANIILHDVENGVLRELDGRTLRDLITEYMTCAQNDQIHRFATAIGVDETKLRRLMQSGATEANINCYGRLDELRESVDRGKAKALLEKMTGSPIEGCHLNMRIDDVLRKFVFEGGFDVEATRL
ncbi:MAG: type I restriction endonuclease subunit R, partial [Kiritimatiellia bacterium]